MKLNATPLLLTTLAISSSTLAAPTPIPRDNTDLAPPSPDPSQAKSPRMGGDSPMLGNTPIYPTGGKGRPGPAVLGGGVLGRSKYWGATKRQLPTPPSGVSGIVGGIPLGGVGGILGNGPVNGVGGTVTGLTGANGLGGTVGGLTGGLPSTAGITATAGGITGNGGLVGGLPATVSQTTGGLLNGIPLGTTINGVLGTVASLLPQPLGGIVGSVENVLPVLPDGTQIPGTTNANTQNLLAGGAGAAGTGEAIVASLGGGEYLTNAGRVVGILPDGRVIPITSGSGAGIGSLTGQGQGSTGGLPTGTGQIQGEVNGLPAGQLQGLINGLSGLTPGQLQAVLNSLPQSQVQGLTDGLAVNTQATPLNNLPKSQAASNDNQPPISSTQSLPGNPGVDDGSIPDPNQVARYVQIGSQIYAVNSSGQIIGMVPQTALSAYTTPSGTSNQDPLDSYLQNTSHSPAGTKFNETSVIPTPLSGNTTSIPQYADGEEYDSDDDDSESATSEDGLLGDDDQFDTDSGNWGGAGGSKGWGRERYSSISPSATASTTQPTATMSAGGDWNEATTLWTEASATLSSMGASMTGMPGSSSMIPMGSAGLS